MRLRYFLKEEDIVQTALDIIEPKVKGKYSERVIKNNKETIEKAISKVGEPKDEAEEAILSDLEDKLEKWNNIEKETKPAGPIKSDNPPPEGGEEPPPEEEEEPPPKEEEEPPPEEEEEDKKKE